ESRHLREADPLAAEEIAPALAGLVERVDVARHPQNLPTAALPYSPHMADMKASEHWQEEAERWAAWARAPGHDAYWYYRHAFFELVPAPGRATLEVGCGEGRVTRDLVARGHRVTALDVVPQLVELARAEDPESTYIVADAAALPFADGHFD